MTGKGAAMPLREEFAELRTRFEAHVEVEEKWQERMETALRTVKDKVSETQKGIWWIKAMVLALLICIPTISGLLVYIFQMHQHGG